MSWKFNRLFAWALLSNKMADLVSCRSSFIRAAEEIAKVQLGCTSSRLPPPPPPHLYPFGKQGQPVLTFKYMYFICPLGGKFSRRPSVNVRFDSSDKPVRASSNAVPLYWGLAYRIKGHQSTVAVPGWSSFLVCIRIGRAGHHSAGSPTMTTTQQLCIYHGWNATVTFGIKNSSAMKTVVSIDRWESIIKPQRMLIP